jgi:hypothetical protein
VVWRKSFFYLYTLTGKPPPADAAIDFSQAPTMYCNAYGDELEDDPDLGYATYRQLFPMPSKEELATLKAADRAETDV